MNKEETIILITERIKSEHRKHKEIEWERIAACKIYASLNKLYNLHGVVGRSEQLKTKFTVGQKVVVCNELLTTITRIEGDKYWFADEEGKEWFEMEDVITAL